MHVSISMSGSYCSAAHTLISPKSSLYPYVTFNKQRDKSRMDAAKNTEETNSIKHFYCGCKIIVQICERSYRINNSISTKLFSGLSNIKRIGTIRMKISEWCRNNYIKSDILRSNLSIAANLSHWVFVFNLYFRLFVVKYYSSNAVVCNAYNCCMPWLDVCLASERSEALEHLRYVCVLRLHNNTTVQYKNNEIGSEQSMRSVNMLIYAD